MAANRERRANAGNRIATLLDEEEVADEFYKTAMWTEPEEEDKDYQ